MTQTAGPAKDDLFDAAPDPALLLDPAWQVVRANAAARALFALPALPVDFWRAVPDAADDSRARLYRSAMAGGPAAAFDQHVTATDAWYAVRCLAMSASAGDAAGGLLVTLTPVTHLRRSDADLAEREQRYRLMFEQSPLPIFVYDVGTQRITMANDAFLAQYGYPRSVLIGMSVFDLCTPQESQWARELVASYTPTTGTKHLSLHHSRWDGSTFPVDVTTHGFVVAGRAVRAGLAVDTTERDRAERDLRESERKYRSLIETADSVVVALDLAHRITEWNKAAERVSGYGRDEVLGRDYHELFVPPELRPAVAAESAKITAGEPTRGFEGVMITKAGQRRTLLWNAHRQVDPAGQAVGEVCVAQDITDRKRAEDALRASEQLHRTLGDAMPQLMWTLGVDGSFEYVNARFADFTALTVADLARHGPGDGAWAAFVHPDDLPALVDRWRHDRAAAAAGEMEVRWCGGRQCREDGHWFLVRHAPLVDRDGRVLRWVGTATDVDELKRAHADLQRAKDAADQANAAKDQFLAVLSHELRTPLTPVLLTASALQGDPALSDDLREAVTMIVEQVELEARLIDDLLDLTRIARGKFLLNPQRFDGHDLVRRAVEVCRSTVDDAGVRLTVELSADERQLSADPARIQQVLCNLLNNAAKFTPTGGRVSLRTRNEASALAGSPSMFVVEVSDTGVGIDAEALPRIFNAFEQGERSITRRFGGLGLGLTIGRTIADMHGGSLAAASLGAGRGATLTLRLPTVATAAPAIPAAAEPAAAVRRLKVLLVDDHVPTLRMMTRLIQSLGHDVRAADSAAAALALVHVDCPDLLISDIGMPAQSGWSLMSAVRDACDPPPAAIAVSGYGTDDDVRRSRDAGFDRHLVKPISLADLRRAIDELTVAR
jgi:two-component system CheB/CheR fusion protein